MENRTIPKVKGSKVLFLFLWSLHWVSLIRHACRLDLMQHVGVGIIILNMFSTKKATILKDSICMGAETMHAHARLRGVGRQCDGRGPWPLGPMNIGIYPTCIWPIRSVLFSLRCCGCFCSGVLNSRGVSRNPVIVIPVGVRKRNGAAVPLPPSLKAWHPAVPVVSDLSSSIFSYRVWRCLFDLILQLRFSIRPCDPIHTVHASSHIGTGHRQLIIFF
jgi:hypothetical protein